jgi:CheY-like chemotaxis protein
MTQPLTLLLYERLMPCSPLVNRLEDRGYRVQSISDPARLVATAEAGKPILAIVDLEPKQAQVCEAIAQLRNNATTAHLPVIAIASAEHTRLQEAARGAGATLVVQENAILHHLDQFLQQALHVE